MGTLLFLPVKSLLFSAFFYNGMSFIFKNSSMKPKKNPTNRNEMLKLIKKTTSENKGKQVHPMLIVLLVAVIISLFYIVSSNSPKEIVNEKIGINEVLTQYLSGSYSEIVVMGESLEAKKPAHNEAV